MLCTNKYIVKSEHIKTTDDHSICSATCINSQANIQQVAAHLKPSHRNLYLTDLCTPCRTFPCLIPVPTFTGTFHQVSPIKWISGRRKSLKGRIQFTSPLLNPPAGSILPRSNSQHRPCPALSFYAQACPASPSLASACVPATHMVQCNLKL